MSAGIVRTSYGGNQRNLIWCACKIGVVIRCVMYNIQYITHLDDRSKCYIRFLYFYNRGNFEINGGGASCIGR